jgi:hypothetical protein
MEFYGRVAELSRNEGPFLFYLFYFWFTIYTIQMVSDD